MYDTPITIVGNLVADPEARTTSNGAPMVSFRVAVNERWRLPDGSYRDGTPSYYRVAAYRALAVNVYASLAKGAPVIVSGRVRMSTWTREDGCSSATAEITADSIGPDLRWGQSQFNRVRTGQHAGPPPAKDSPAHQPTDSDPHRGMTTMPAPERSGQGSGEAA